MKSPGATYCRSARKRVLDLGLTLPALIALSPLLLLLGLLIRVASGTPVFFRQERVGRDGRLFVLLKFRTMEAGPPTGLPITGAGDRRVTGIGRLLRRAKLDELPQLLNVLRGEMSLVGPRPEVERYVMGYTPEQRRVLTALPGLTDPASIVYRDEEALLGSVPEVGREDFYVRQLLPRKLALSLDYIPRATVASDLRILLKTGCALLGMTSR